MEIRVEQAKLAVTKFRIAQALVHYHELGFFVDICLYKDEKLWVRMPEMWVTPTKKKRFFFWHNKEDSDRCQEIVLNKVFDMLGLDLDTAIKEKNRFFEQKNKLTLEENNITLSKHSSEV